MAPGGKGTAGAPSGGHEFKYGDLVLAKVGINPAWPAKISRAEDWERTPDPEKHYVHFFGTKQLAFVAPDDIQPFTSEVKSRLSARKGRTSEYFPRAVKEICEEFEALQQTASGGMRANTYGPSHETGKDDVQKAVEVDPNIRSVKQKSESVDVDEKPINAQVQKSISLARLPAKKRVVRLLEDTCQDQQRQKTPVHVGSVRRACDLDSIRRTSTSLDFSQRLKRPEKGSSTNICHSPPKIQPDMMVSEEAGLHLVAPARSYSSHAILQSEAIKQPVVAYISDTDYARTPILSLEPQFTPESSSRMKDSVTVANKPLEISSPNGGERLEKGKEKMIALSESNVKDSATTMEHLLPVSQEETRGVCSQSLPPIQASVVPPIQSGSTNMTQSVVALDDFKAMIETMSRSKESIGRATHLAFDCAKNGIASEVMEHLISKMETEPSLHRRVKLLFLVDSITQCSHMQKGIAGACFIPIIQAALPRLLGAAAPSVVGAHENRKQCRKVLQIWIERKILPESSLQHFVDAISHSDDDTVREIDGMLVNEYGSNDVHQFPGHFFSQVSEGEVPESSCKDDDDRLPVGDINDKLNWVLEDIDGEIQMEDAWIPSPPDSPPLPPPLPTSPMPSLPPMFFRSHAYPHPPPSLNLPSSVESWSLVSSPFPQHIQSLHSLPYSFTQRVSVPPPPPVPVPSSQFSYLSSAQATDVLSSEPRPYLQRPPLASSAVVPPPMLSGPWPPFQRPLADAFQPPSVNIFPPQISGFQQASANIVPLRPPVPGIMGQSIMPYGQLPSFDGSWRPA